MAPRRDIPNRPNIDRTRAPFVGPRQPDDHTTQTDWYPPVAYDPNTYIRVTTMAPARYRDAPGMVPFMMSEFDAFDGKQWTPVRMLGQGAFGEVGYWRRVGSTGQIVDEVALKEQAHLVPHPLGLYFYETPGMREAGIAEEAVCVISW